MIPNVTHGGRARGLMKYLLEPKEIAETGKSELHTNPHLITAGHGLMDEWAGYDLAPQYNPTAAEELAAWLDEPRLATGTKMMATKRVAKVGADGQPVLDDRGAIVRVPKLDRNGKRLRGEAHVWHCSLSLHPDEPAQSDEEWANIVNEFVVDMGFEDCRWLAIRHGAGPNDNDHVHVVVQLVRENGKGASFHNDYTRAQERCRELERKYGLHQVEGREHQRGARTTTPKERKTTEREHRQGRRATPEARPVLLERAVRAAAQASATEADFVRRLRAGGYPVRPRFEAARDDRVVGFSIAEPPAPGEDLIPYAAGKLAKDLTLPRLRGTYGWRADDAAGVDEWQRAFRGDPPGAPPALPGTVSDEQWDEAIAAIRDLRHSAAELTPDDLAGRAQVAGQAAALAYSWAAYQPTDTPVLTNLGRELARSSQIRAAAAKTAAPARTAQPAAMLMAALTRPQNQTLYWLVFCQQLEGLTRALRDLHQAAGELERATALTKLIREDLAPVGTALSDEHAAADSAYATERDRRRQERADATQPSAAPSPTVRPQPPVVRRPSPIRRPRGRGHNR